MIFLKIQGSFKGNLVNQGLQASCTSTISKFRSSVNFTDGTSRRSRTEGWTSLNRRPWKRSRNTVRTNSLLAARSQVTIIRPFFLLETHLCLLHLAGIPNNVWSFGEGVDEQLVQAKNESIHSTCHSPTVRLICTCRGNVARPGYGIQWSLSLKKMCACTYSANIAIS
jgi:hypothetical protein